MSCVELLDDPEVVAEIERYKWIEVERSGRDIGFEQASLEWLRHNAVAWRRINARLKRSSWRDGMCLRLQQKSGRDC